MSLRLYYSLCNFMSFTIVICFMRIFIIKYIEVIKEKLPIITLYIILDIKLSR